MVGIDAIGGKLHSVVFRPEIATRLLNVRENADVTPEMVAELVTNKSGPREGVS